MFNFTTQTVYNSIKQGTNMWLATGTKKPSLRIGNTRFDADDILDICIKYPTKEVLAKVTFDMSKVALTADTDPSEATGRIALYLGLSMNSQDAFYANDLVYKGKPLYVEFPIKKGETAAALATKVKSIADKYLLFMTDEKLLTVTAKDGKITIEGVNGYQQIKVAKLQKFDTEAKKIDCCTNAGEYVDVVVGVPVVWTTNKSGVILHNTIQKLTFDGKTTSLESLESNEVAIWPGLEAFGDYNWIIHNLRLPTLANANFWAPTKTEMPVPGGEYVQIIVTICKERDGISGEIVGARAKSVTTHVLYVLRGNDSNNVIDAFKQVLGENVSKIYTNNKLMKPFETTDYEQEVAPTSEESSEGSEESSEGESENSTPQQVNTEP